LVRHSIPLNIVFLAGKTLPDPDKDQGDTSRGNGQLAFMLALRCNNVNTLKSSFIHFLIAFNFLKNRGKYFYMHAE
jgi:hypothetical protein